MGQKLVITEANQYIFILLNLNLNICSRQDGLFVYSECIASFQVFISSSDESSVDDCEMKMDLARSNVQRSGKVMVIEDSSLLKELLATGQTIEKMKKSNQERNDG